MRVDLGGICAVRGENARHLVKAMSNCLRHRGPDDEGFYCGQNVALGHRALFKADSERVHQPLSNEDETIWVTLDGEIYNLEQLKKNLEERHRFRSDSASEIVIHAYEEEDVYCIEKFNGDFAFSLWDSRKRVLWSARDKMGVKPLYYSNGYHRDLLLVASEIKALLADPTFPRRPNEHVICEYLLKGPRSHIGETFFAGVMELLPAHYMLVTDDGVELHKYWSPRRSSQPRPRKNEAGRDCASGFLELLQDSVRIRVPENLPIGTFLSGGVDSSAVACLIDRVLSSNPERAGSKSQVLISATYPNTLADERAFSEQVARSLGNGVVCINPTAEGQWEDIKKFIYHMDEPVPVLNYYAYWCLSREAGRRVVITFSGQGPDEILGGHIGERMAYIRELWKRRTIIGLICEVIGSLAQYDFWDIITVLASFSARPAIRELLGSNEGGMENQIKRLFSRDFADSASVENSCMTLGEFLVREATETLLLDHLEFGDRAASAFSTETRYPYLDYRLVEFIFSLPANQKFRNGWSKFVLRNAVKGIVPVANRKRRRKMGTPVPLERWLTDLNGQIERVFESEKFLQRGYFNQPAVLDLYRRYCNGELKHLEKAFYANILWRILNLELWFRAYFDLERIS